MAPLSQLPPMDGAVLRTRVQGGMSGGVTSVLESLWRRKWVPLVCLAAGWGLGLLAMAAMPPLYKAQSQIMIETTDRDNGVLQSEVAIATSPPVLSKVAGRLMLYRDPEFSKARLSDKVLLRGGDENAVRDRVMHRLDSMIDVRVKPGTSIIDMVVHNTDPDRAAQIANAVLASYQERKVDERFEQSRQIGIWMTKRLEEIKAEGQTAKQVLEDFHVAHGRLAPGGSQLQAERMVIINRDIANAQNDIATLSSRLEQARGGKGAGDSFRAVLKSERINALKKTETELSLEVTQMAQRYGDRHPRMIAKKAQLEGVRKSIQAETRRVLQSTAQELQAARDRLQKLESQIEVINTDVDFDSRLTLQMKNLESEIAANDRLYADFQIKYQDVMADAELRGSDMKVISMATIPSQPDQSARIAMAFMLGVFGFVLGFLYVLLRILWAKGFTGAGQLEGMSGYPVFGAIPMAGVKGQTAVHHHVTQDPAAILAESLRSLRVSLRLRGESERRARVIAFTSTLPDEGKTSLAVMLAMIASKAGERVCVVDCDLRRPSLHKAFGIGNARGLADYLSDRLSADDVIHRKDPSGVHLVTAKAVPSYSLTLLTSGRMERLIDSLREQYDLVILDAPSSLAFADARVLARMVDQTMYVVAWNRTRRETVLASLKAYADMGYADLALVLNKVDLNEYLRDSAAAVVYQYGREAGPENLSGMPA